MKNSGPPTAGRLNTGLASVDVAVVPPKMQFDVQAVVPPDVVTLRHR